MKTIHVSVTYLHSVTVEDDKNIDEAVAELLEEEHSSGTYNDVEYEEVFSTKEKTPAFILNQQEEKFLSQCNHTIERAIDRFYEKRKELE